MENNQNIRKMLQKRNYYSIKDSGSVFLYALILPLAAGLLFSYVSMFIAMKCGMQFPKDSNVIEVMFDAYLWFAIPYTLLTQLVFAGIYLSYHKFSRISFRASNVQFKKINPVTAVLSALMGIVAVLGFVWLIEGCFGHVFTSWKIPSNSLALPLDNVGWLFVNLLILGVIPAVCEELLFRGIIFQGLREKFSPALSVILCGLLFALIHQSLTQFIYPFVLGCALALVMCQTGNLIYCMLIHMFNNFTTIILSFLLETGALKLSFNVSWWGWICAILLALVAVALFLLFWILILRKHNSVAVEKEGENNQTPPSLVGKLPLTLIIGMTLAVILIVINAVG